MPIIAVGVFLWEGDLINLKQSEIATGRAGAEIYFRLAASELEPQIGSGSIRTGKVERFYIYSYK